MVRGFWNERNEFMYPTPRYLTADFDGLTLLDKKMNSDCISLLLRLHHTYDCSSAMRYASKSSKVLVPYFSKEDKKIIFKTQTN